MLKILRKKGTVKKITWIIIVFIIVAFGFGGTLYLLKGKGQTKYAGKIFGKKVSFEKFESAYREIVIQSMMQYGDEFNKIKSMLNLEAKTWDLLILLTEAKKQKIKATDEEVKNAIMKQYPFFIRENKFDPKLYKDILRYIFRIKPRDFEENVRNSIKVQKLFNMQTSSLVITEEDVYKKYKKQNEKIQISYVFVSADKFKDQVNYDEEQIKQYYLDNEQDFLMPPSINAEYISFDFPEQKDQEDFEEQKNIIKEDAFYAFNNSDVNSNLEEIAKDNELEIKETGFFSLENPNLSIGWSYKTLNEMFTLKKEEMYGPFESPNGVYIARIKNKKQAYIPDYESVKEDAKQKLLTQESKKIAKEKTTSYLESIKQKLGKTQLEDFNKTAKSLDLKVIQTPIFSRGEYLPKIGISKTFQEAAFNLNVLNKISNVVEVDKGYCVLHLDSYLAINVEKYNEEKDAFYQEVLNEESNKIFNNFLTALRLKAELKDNMSKLKKTAAK